MGSFFCGLLTIIFVLAKLLGYITWSWWLVLLPAYLGLAIALVMILFLAFVSWIAS